MTQKPPVMKTLTKVNPSEATAYITACIAIKPDVFGSPMSIVQWLCYLESMSLDTECLFGV
jgi:hypothetical protein